MSLRERDKFGRITIGKNLARVTGLHTLLVLNVLKMLEATSFEMINAVKKWTGMQNKQCIAFNSSDLLQV